MDRILLEEIYDEVKAFPQQALTRKLREKLFDYLEADGYPDPAEADSQPYAWSREDIAALHSR